LKVYRSKSALVVFAIDGGIPLVVLLVGLLGFDPDFAP
jgi:hypothetical protein